MDADRRTLTTYQDLAQKIDHSLVRPHLTDDDIRAGCELAAQYEVATVSVRPSDVELAVSVLRGANVRVGSVAGFPHGSETTPAKTYQARDLLRRGVKEIDMVLNIGKLLSRQFQYVEMELMQMAQACHDEGAVLKVIFENAYLTDDLKIIACKICKRTGVDFAKTATGFAPGGATMEDLRLMVTHCAPRVKVKAAGGVRTLDKALEVCAIGCERIGATATEAILDAWKQRLAGAARPTASEESGSAGGY